MRHQRNGFTLIELMIVVAIIGILAAIAIPNFLRSQMKAKSSEGKINIAAIRTAEVSYNAEFGQYQEASASPAGEPSDTKRLWVPVGDGFPNIGFQPDSAYGETPYVRFNYEVTVSSKNEHAFAIYAEADIDNDGTPQLWTYRHNPRLGENDSPLPEGFEDCANGAFSGFEMEDDQYVKDEYGEHIPIYKLSRVGPCDEFSGQSVF